MGLVGLAEDRVEVDLGHVGPGQAKYLETARVAPGVGQGHSGAGPSPCGSYGGTFTGVRTVVSWGAWSPAESDVVGPVRVGRGERRPR